MKTRKYILYFLLCFIVIVPAFVNGETIENWYIEHKTINSLDKPLQYNIFPYNEDLQFDVLKYDFVGMNFTFVVESAYAYVYADINGTVNDYRPVIVMVYIRNGYISVNQTFVVGIKSTVSIIKTGSYVNTYIELNAKVDNAVKYDLNVTYTMFVKTAYTETNYTRITPPTGTYANDIPLLNTPIIISIELIILIIFILYVKSTTK